MTFGPILDDALEQRGLTRADFCRLVKVQQQFLHSIIAGTRKVPPARIIAWADALDLKGDDRRSFVVAAMLPKCPKPVWPYLEPLIKPASGNRALKAGKQKRKSRP